MFMCGGSAGKRRNMALNLRHGASTELGLTRPQKETTDTTCFINTFARETLRKATLLEGLDSVIKATRHRPCSGSKALELSSPPAIKSIGRSCVRIYDAAAQRHPGNQPPSKGKPICFELQNRYLILV